MKIAIRSIALVSFHLASAVPSIAQCAEWDDGLDPGILVRSASRAGDVYAFAEFDDGTGPAVYVGGDFITIDGVTVNRVAKRLGPQQWAPLGSGVSGRVYALATFDDGSGPALYATGLFNTAGGNPAPRFARWNGSSWSAAGIGFNNGIVRCMTVIDDGFGEALYFGGDFTMAGGVPANHVAKWDGSTWSALGAGVSDEILGIQSIAAFDDGSGLAIYVGGDFKLAGGSSATGVAKWDGIAWSSLGSGLALGASRATANALRVYDDGAGPALFGGGEFTTAGGVVANDIARWDGTNWSALGAGCSNAVLGLTVHDDGSGPALIAGGAFTMAGGASASEVAKWNGSNWTTIGTGLPDGTVRALLSFDDGSGPLLFGGGAFPRCIASWDGSEWGPHDHGIGGDGKALAVFDDGTGPALFAGGSFVTASGTVVNHIAKWDGTTWSPLSSGTNQDVRALLVFDDNSGFGETLFAGGSFTTAGGSPANHIAKWDGSAWTPLASGTNGTVQCLAVFDDGTGAALYVGGSFGSADGVDAANGIARWNGASWSALGTGLVGTAYALAVWDDGSGPALFVGGSFSHAGGMAAPNIAKWTGTAWQAVPGGLNSAVLTLEVWDDGTGAKLFAGGSFLTIGGFPYGHVGRWDGANWQTLGTGMNGEVDALLVFDDGSGAALYASGAFSTAGGTFLQNVAKWDGANWSVLDGGVTGVTPFVRSMAVFDDGSDGASDLYAIGRFETASGNLSRNFGMWHGCEPGTAYCFGDGVDSVVTALCPCGNFGDAGRGCANSNASLGGGKLWASGSTSPNTLVFTCDGIPNNSFATFLRSNASDDSGFVFGDGIKCLSGTGIRFGAQNAGQGGNPSNTVISTAATVASGNTRYYQLHYRNPNAGFCPPETFNISNGYSVAW